MANLMINNAADQSNISDADNNQDLISANSDNN